VSAEWPLIRKPNVVDCAVEGCPAQPYLRGLCKFHGDAKFYCEEILGLEEYDLARFGR
jgi:hypothetical protein